MNFIIKSSFDLKLKCSKDIPICKKNMKMKVYTFCFIRAIFLVVTLNEVKGLVVIFSFTPSETKCLLFVIFGFNLEED